MVVVTLINVHNCESSQIDLGHGVQKVPSLQFLHDLIFQKYRLDSGSFVCKDSLGVELSDDSLADVTRIFIHKKGSLSAPLKVSLEEDIIPDINILTKSGDEYDFISALAELIDNSIQNTAVNYDDREIRINFCKEEASISIWDNGRGMNIDEVKNWATLGRSDSPDLTVLAKKYNSFTLKKKKYITSDFSRYGVGSKRAVFNIGSRVQLTSKNKLSPYVTEVCLDKHLLDQDRTWKATLTIRDPTEEENCESFTRILISNVNKLYIKEYQTEFVCKKLAHIYHYYIHGSFGNPTKRSSQTTFDTDTDESSSELDEDQEYDPPDISITVDGIDLRNINNDLESLYLRYGRRRLKFAIPLQVESIEKSSTQNVRVILNSKVYVELYYFPTEDGKESLPIPHSRDVKIEDPNLFSLHERNPGFEVFWNGRLLPRAHLRSLAFMQDIKNHFLPSSCFSRIKGMLFVDSTFVVNATKLDLKREGFPLYTALLQFTNRRIKQKFSDWLLRCHTELDMEIKYLQLDLDKNSKDGRFYFYKSINFRGETLSVGDNVKLNTRPQVAGTIIEIYRESDSEFSQTCFIKVQDIQGDIFGTHPVSLYYKKLSPSELKKLQQQIQQKQDRYLKVVKTPNVSGSQCLPPSSAKAGFKLNYISVCIYDGSSKPIQINGASVSMKVKYFHQQTEMELFNEIAMNSYKGSLYCFKLQNKDQDVVSFNKVGLYTFEFSTNIQDIQPITTKIYIEPSTPHKISLRRSNRTHIPLGQSFNIKLRFEDEFGNNVPYTEFDSSKLSVKMRSSSKSKISLDASNMSVDVYKKKVTICGLRISEGITEEENPSRFDLQFIYPSLVPAVYEGRLIPGEIAKVIPTEDFSELYRKKKGAPNPIPNLSYFLVDKCGNQVHVAEAQCILESDSFSSNYESSISQNKFEFQNLHVEESSKEVFIKARVSIGELSIENVINISMKVTKQIPTSIRLAFDEFSSLLDVTMAKRSIIIKGTPKLQIPTSKFYILDANEIHINNFKGSFIFDDTEISVKEGIGILPSLSLPESGNSNHVKLHLLSDSGSKLLSFDVTLSSYQNPPTAIEFEEVPDDIKCCVPFTLSLAIVNDEKFTFERDIFHRYEKILKRVIPKVSIEPSEESEWSELELLDGWIASQIVDEGRFTISNLRVKGCPSNFFFKLTIQDESRTLRPCSIEKEMNPGQVVEARLNSKHRQSLKIQNFGQLEPMTITCHDVCGNLSKFDCDSQLDMIITPTGLKCVCDDMQQSSYSLTQRDDGSITIPSMYLHGEVGETYRLELTTVEQDIDIKTFLDVTILPSNIPKSIIIRGITSKEVKAGCTIEPSAEIVGEDGQPCQNQYSVRLIATVNGFTKTFVGRMVNDTPGLYTFKKKNFVMTRAGKAKFQVLLSYKDQVNAIVKKLPDLIQEEVITIHHDVPTSLQFAPNILLSTISNDADEPIETRSFFEKSSVMILDRFGNCCTSINEGKIFLSINSDTDSDSKPIIGGERSACIVNGIAYFDWRVHILPNSGKAGEYYTLQAHSNILNISCSFEFLYADVKSQRGSLNEIEKAISQCEDQRKAIREQISQIKESKVFAKEKKKEVQELQNYEIERFMSSSLYLEIGKDIQDTWELYRNSSVFSIKQRITYPTLEKELKRLEKIVEARIKRTPRCTVRGRPTYEIDAILDHSTFNQTNSKIIGLLIDIGYVNEEDIDKAICCFLKTKLHAIIVEDGNTSQKICAYLRNTVVKHPVHIISVNNITVQQPKMKNRKFSFPEDEFKSCKGYLGFAVNFIEIHPEMSDKIMQVFYALLGKTRIFDTEKNAREALSVVNGSTLDCDVLTLDNYCFSTNGMTIVEATSGSIRERRRFGELSLEDEKQKLRSALEIFREIMKLELEMVTVQRNFLLPTLKDFEKEIDNLETELETINEEIINLNREKGNIIGIMSSQGSIYSKSSLKRKSQNDGITKASKRMRSQSPDMDED